MKENIMNNQKAFFQAADSQKRYAFTLAEVLITLGIIGVVAALTMPSLIMKYQKQIFATKVKYAYNIVSRALQASIQENGTPDTWNYGNSRDANAECDDACKAVMQNDLKFMVDKYFLPYFKTAKIVPSKTNEYSIVINNGITLSFFIDGTNIIEGSGANAHTVYIPRTLYIIASFNNNTTHYAYKTRDYSKQDVFMLVNYKSGNKLLFWNSNTSLSNMLNSGYGCNENIDKNKRFSCGALIQYYGWQIKEDYPWNK